jgi:hypothetical protein
MDTSSDEAPLARRRSNRVQNQRREHIGYMVHSTEGGAFQITLTGERLTARSEGDGIEFFLPDGTVAPALPHDAPWVVYLDDDGHPVVGL